MPYNTSDFTPAFSCTLQTYNPNRSQWHPSDAILCDGTQHARTTPRSSAGTLGTVCSAGSHTIRRSGETVQDQSLPRARARHQTPHRRRDIDLVFVEKRLQVDCVEIDAALLKAIGCIVARLADSPVMQEVHVELGFMECPIVAPLLL